MFARWATSMASLRIASSPRRANGFLLWILKNRTRSAPRRCAAVSDARRYRATAGRGFATRVVGGGAATDAGALGRAACFLAGFGGTLFVGFFMIPSPILGGR